MLADQLPTDWFIWSIFQISNAFAHSGLTSASVLPGIWETKMPSPSQIQCVCSTTVQVLGRTVDLLRYNLILWNFLGLLFSLSALMLLSMHFKRILWPLSWKLLSTGASFALVVTLSDMWISFIFFSMGEQRWSKTLWILILSRNSWWIISLRNPKNWSLRCKVHHFGVRTSLSLFHCYYAVLILRYDVDSPSARLDKHVSTCTSLSVPSLQNELSFASPGVFSRNYGVFVF